MVEVVANRLNRLGYRSTNYTFPIEVWSRDVKNIFSFSVAFLSWLRDMSSGSRSSRDIRVTYHAFNTQRLVNRSTPNLIGQDCFLTFWLLRLETYKLRVPLHLWARVHLHLFIYIFVLALKALILFLVH